MDWKYWIGKKVFVSLKNGSFYNGVINEVDESSSPLIWFEMTDKFEKKIQFVHSEIVKIVEEEK